MAKTSICVSVSYGQIAVFDSSLQNPFSDWSQKHTDQGFAWRAGTVSFRTLYESGRHTIELELVDDPAPISVDAIRVVEVPFDVPHDGAIEVASISDATALTLPSRAYSLRVEFFSQDQDGSIRVKLFFIRNGSTSFAVLRADKDLILEGDLLTEADPA